MIRRGIFRFSVLAAAVGLTVGVAPTPFSSQAMAASTVSLNTFTGSAYTLGFVSNTTVTADPPPAAAPPATAIYNVLGAPTVQVTNLPSPWVPNSATSSWIGANSSGTAAGTLLAGTGNQYQVPGFNDASSSPQGYYYYTTTFVLTPGAYSVTGAVWTSDNQGLAIYLNNKLELPGTNPGNFGTLVTPFSLASADFNIGLNTLTFVTWNEEYSPIHGSPAGLRVEGTVGGITAVPEPASIALIAYGLPVVGGLCWFRRRRASV